MKDTKEKSQLVKSLETPPLTEDQQTFVKDLQSCGATVKQAFGTDTVDPSVVFALFNAVGAPEDLPPSKREHLMRDLRQASALAKELFDDASAETAFKVFYIYSVELDTDENDEDVEPEEALRVATKMARDVFGSAKVDAALEIFERFFVLDEDDDDDDDEDDEDDDTE